MNTSKLTDTPTGRILSVIFIVATIALGAMSAHSNAVSSIKKDIRDYLFLAIQNIQDNQIENKVAIENLRRDILELRTYVIRQPYTYPPTKPQKH